MDKSINLKEIDSNKRSKIVKFNLLFSIIIKFTSLLINFITVRFTIKYLGIELNGVWTTILSILSWITFFDIGLGNGLRNKLTELFAENKINEARKYIGSAYAFIGIISVALIILTSIIIPFLNWNKIFNTNIITNKGLIIMIFIVVISMMINFTVSISNQIYFAMQKSIIPSLSQVIMSLLNLIVVIILLNFERGNILLYAAAYCMIMISTNVVFMIIFFILHKALTPTKNCINFGYLKNILGTGIKFFIIQISTLIIFTTDNMIITQVMGPSEVTLYNSVYKIFSFLTMLHSLIVTPLWSAYTDAYNKRDFVWIRNILYKLNLLMIPVIIGCIILSFLSGIGVRILTDLELTIEKDLVILMAIYSIITIWNNIYAYFLNGINELNIQLLTSVIGGIINIPLSIYFARYLNMGSSGVILSTIISLSFFAVLGPIQTYIILKKEK